MLKSHGARKRVFVEGISRVASQKGSLIADSDTGLVRGLLWGELPRRPRDRISPPWPVQLLYKRIPRMNNIAGPYTYRDDIIRDQISSYSRESSVSTSAISPLRTLKSTCIAFVSPHYYLLLRFRAIYNCLTIKSRFAKSVKDEQHVLANFENIASGAISVQDVHVT